MNRRVIRRACALDRILIIINITFIWYLQLFVITISQFIGKSILNRPCCWFYPRDITNYLYLKREKEEKKNKISSRKKRLESFGRNNVQSILSPKRNKARLLLIFLTRHFRTYILHSQPSPSPISAWASIERINQHVSDYKVIHLEGTI